MSDHVCGANGFGRGANDVCPACKSVAPVTAPPVSPVTLDLNAIKARVDKAFASLSKAYPYLVKHADHIDGEFDNALSTLRQEIERLTAERDDLATNHDQLRIRFAATVREWESMKSRLASLSAEYAALGKVVKDWQEARRVRLDDHADTRETHDRYRDAKVALASFPVEEAP